MDPQSDYIAALIDLHRGLKRKGPGDTDFSRQILGMLPDLSPKPQIADMGCGSGAGALLLAEHFQSPVTAVDLSSEFISELQQHAQELGLDHLINPLQQDMATLNWPDGSIDLLWSEGAAYHLGFENALNSWRSLLTPKGIAVISELSWFTPNPPKPAIAFWQEAYPAMGTEAENLIRAERAGFQKLATVRLPSQAWWNNYYNPLRDNIKAVDITPANELVIRETEVEMQLFEQFSESYGYTFYILQNH